MNLLARLLGVRDLPPPMRRDTCPDCGAFDFTPGGPTVMHESDGVSARIVTVSAVLSCLSCGARLYGTADGLQRPHEAALPPAWALADMQAKAREAQAAAQQAKGAVARAPEERPRVPRGPADGFRKPPRAR